MKLDLVKAKLSFVKAKLSFPERFFYKVSKS
jgi:hypothetical protein